MIRVLIVEDQKMAQENMEAIIRSSENYALAGIIPNAADAELFCMRTMELLIAVASKNLIIVTPDKALADSDS